MAQAPPGQEKLEGRGRGYALSLRTHRQRGRREGQEEKPRRMGDEQEGGGSGGWGGEKG